MPREEVRELGCRHYVEHFRSYVLPEELQKSRKAPRVMIGDEAWPGVCRGLLERGVCILLSEAELLHVGGQPLLNGLFGVKKGEEEEGVPVHRLIMELRPCNLVCRGIEGGVATLPSCATVGPISLRCFFYIKVPTNLSSFQPSATPELWPDGHDPCYAAPQALPTGAKNSVSVAGLW